MLVGRQPREGTPLTTKPSQASLFTCQTSMTAIRCEPGMDGGLRQLLSRSFPL